ncbi:MAG TPA: hypothetical protein VE733_14595 [Streptosporangiaceae bacterium]|nr:hypothetical protein [Streptosporangiaceae bacterium]
MSASQSKRIAAGADGSPAPVRAREWAFQLVHHTPCPVVVIRGRVA